jgi:hypothetical protein
VTLKSCLERQPFHMYSILMLSLRARFGRVSLVYQNTLVAYPKALFSIIFRVI